MENRRVPLGGARRFFLYPAVAGRGSLRPSQQSRGIAMTSGASAASRVPTGTELARPFLPAKDFELSKRFYETLGFEKVLDGDVAIFNAASGGFILQRYYQKEWAENFMMQLMVDDLDAWWMHISALDLPQRFKVPPPRAPAMQPWGLRIAYVVDPSGVLWHIAQRRADAAQDR